MKMVDIKYFLIVLASAIFVSNAAQAGGAASAPSFETTFAAGIGSTVPQPAKISATSKPCAVAK
jgi:hypothetical protein